MNFLKKKSYESVRETGANSNLNKTLGAFDLILLGLGAIIGTGVFALTGIIAANHAGPAITLSYAIAGCTCIFVALAYTELATMLPTSGSVYTYSYVAFGEVFAWMIGSVLILELGFAAGAVAASWSGYVQRLLKSADIYLPHALTNVPSEGGVMNLPAFLIVVFIAFILFLGTKDSKKLNAILVFIKMAAIFAFTFFAAPHFDVANWNNFMPFGLNNVLVGSSVLFFAFTGFGTLATAAEECKNPKRDLTIGIIGSLILSTIVYILVGGLLTGITTFDQLNNPEALAHALALNNSHIGSAIVATGAICGMTTVLMMNIYGMSRIFYVIARDGLLPRSFAKLHAKHDSPYVTILVFSTLAALLGAFAPIKELFSLSSMGALIDYIAISLVVMLFRFRLPHVVRPFKCPALFIIAPIALLACIYLLLAQILGADWVTQALNVHFNLETAGRYLLYWFGIMFVLYIMRASTMDRNLQN